ncbi:hypothetical protein [Brevundimonas sp.]|nr:hypothetical protein [Brevundimonas sp.]HWQ86721.1 hypothetical protein [Brevundimonas sp.]
MPMLFAGPGVLIVVQCVAGRGWIVVVIEADLYRPDPVRQTV